MAKSLRSKWKRRMKAEKRVRYGEKELQRLKDMLTKAGDYQMVGESEDPSTKQEQDPAPPQISMKHYPKKARRDAAKSRRSRRDDMDQDEDMNDDPENSTTEKDSSEMSVDKPARVFSKRTMRDQFGNYPEWMNKRKVLTQQKKNKRLKSKARALAKKKK